MHFTPALQWRHNGCDGVSSHQPPDCLLNRIFERRSKKTSKPRVTGLCAGNSPVTGEFPAQRASNAENVSIWWRYHTLKYASVPSGARPSVVTVASIFKNFPWLFQNFLYSFPKSVLPVAECKWHLYYRNHFRYVHGLWEKALHINASSHWLSPYPECSLCWSEMRWVDHRCLNAIEKFPLFANILCDLKGSKSSPRPKSVD